MKRFFMPFVLLFLFFAAPALADDPAPSMNRAEWRSDLDFLYAQMQAIHPSLHHKTDAATMDDAVTRLRRDIPHMTWPEYVMGLYRLLALVGDGHTTFYPQPDAGPGFDIRYPILPAVFADGVFVTAADPAYADAVVAGSSRSMASPRPMCSRHSHNTGITRTRCGHCAGFRSRCAGQAICPAWM